MFSFFYWILFDSCLTIRKQKWIGKKICFLLKCFASEVIKCPAFLFLFQILFFSLLFHSTRWARPVPYEKQKNTELEFGQVRIWSKNEQVQQNIGIKQKLMIAVLVCCRSRYLLTLVHLLFFFSAVHDHEVCYVQVASASHAEVSVHKLKWFKNVNKCVATMAIFDIRIQWVKKKKLICCSCAHRYLKHRHFLSWVIRLCKSTLLPHSVTRIFLI